MKLVVVLAVALQAVVVEHVVVQDWVEDPVVMPVSHATAQSVTVLALQEDEEDVADVLDVA